jgi:hypothetical protein
VGIRIPDLLRRFVRHPIIVWMDGRLGWPLMRLRAWKHIAGFRRNFLASNATPVLVYQMGKVASKSIVATIGRYPQYRAFHVHSLDLQGLKQKIANSRREGRIRQYVATSEWRTTYDLVVKPERNIKIITLVREPIGRNISAFFQGLDKWARVENAHLNVPIETLAETFHRDYPHTRPLTWFDDELKAVTGIDVYAHPFPKADGHQRLRQGRFDVLIMRHDLPDPVKAKCMSEFLDIPGIEIVRDNESENKAYADCYRAFQAAVRLPPEYIEEMLGSKYARHFYPEDEIERLRGKWMKLEKPAKGQPAARKKA